MRTVIACLAIVAATAIGGVAAQDEPKAEEIAPAPTPAEAPDDAADEGRPVRIFAESAAWFTQPIGTDLTYATEIDETSAYSTRTRDVEFGTNDRQRWRVGAVLSGDAGSFVMTYWAASEREDINSLSPGRFLFGETLAYPVFAGVNNDGLTDGVTGTARTTSRDMRLDFVRNAFRSKRMTARWLAGIRFVDHNQGIDAIYRALVPNLPPYINPDGGALAGSLEPLPDIATSTSRFSGRGVEAGFEAGYEILPALHLQADFVYALLRGNLRSEYASTTRAYTVIVGNDEFLVSPDDYDLLFNDPGLFAGLNQRSFGIGIQERGSTASASVLEASLGVRWRAWKGLEVLGGIRQTRYQDVVLEVRPRDVVYSLEGSTNFQAIDRRTKSVGYEGFYLGVAYTF
jgi:hypothetical protein